MSIPDPAKSELHLHVHTIESSRVDPDLAPLVAEQAGVGVLMAMMSALKGVQLKGGALALGRVELSGLLDTVPGAVEGAARLARFGFDWDHIIGANGLGPEFLRLPTQYWYEKKLYLGDDIVDLGELLEEEFGTNA